MRIAISIVAPKTVVCWEWEMCFTQKVNQTSGVIVQAQRNGLNISLSILAWSFISCRYAE